MNSLSQKVSGLYVFLVLSILVFSFMFPVKSTNAEENKKRFLEAHIFYDEDIIEFEDWGVSPAYELPLREIIRNFDVIIYPDKEFLFEKSADLPMEHIYGYTSMGGSGRLKLTGKVVYSDRGSPSVEGNLIYVADVEEINTDLKNRKSTVWHVECSGEFRLSLSMIGREVRLSYGGALKDTDMNKVTRTIIGKDGSQSVEESEHNWFGFNYYFRSETKRDEFETAVPAVSTEVEKNTPPEEPKTSGKEKDNVSSGKYASSGKIPTLISTIAISIISSIVGVGAVAATAGATVPKSEVSEGEKTGADQSKPERINHPNGVVEIRYPNGTRQLKFPDGSTKEKWPDGTITGTTSDGTKFVQKTNGELEMEFSNGEKITEYPDGKIVTIRNNGLKVTDWPDGTSEIYDPEFGEKVIHSPDGTRTFIDKDGKATTVNEDNTIIRIVKDGVVGRRNSDGTCEITYPEGSGKILIDKDKNVKGTVITREGNEYTFDGDENGIDIKTGEGISMHADQEGRIKGELGDGITFDFDPDTKDTNIEMPDGSTMTIDKEGNMEGKDTQTGYEFEINEDGSGEIKDNKGNYYKEETDGSFSIKTEDGWEGTQDADGQQYLKAPNGNDMTRAGDGTVTINYTDGSTGKIYPDKSVELKRPNGRIERCVNNQVTIEKPDGSAEKLSMEEYKEKYGM